MSEAPNQAPVAQNGHVESAQDTGHKVFAGNLAYSTTDEGLKAFFAPVGVEIVSAQVILRGTRSAGYGFVGFATHEDAEKAASLLNKKELDGREVIIEIAKAAEQKDKERAEKKANKRAAGRRGSKAPPGEVTEAEANGDGEKPADAANAEGEAKSKKKKTQRKKKTKTAEEGEEATAGDGAATADAATGEKAKKAKAPRPPRKTRPPRPAGEDPEGEPSQNMLFVANLGFSVDDAALTELFTTAGVKVLSARVVRRRWGQPRKSKGYGFVDVGNAEEQKKAIEALQGKSVAGREIAVKIAVNAKDIDEAVEEAAAKDSAPETVVVAS